MFGRWFSTVPCADFPDRFIPFEGRFFGGFSCRVSAFFWLAWIFTKAAGTSLAPILLQSTCQFMVSLFSVTCENCKTGIFWFIEL
jgi:hypothetical protein